MNRFPKHIAIIMDGNGRWAQQRRRPRIFGHIKGAQVAKKIITACAQRGVKSLTLYAFSTENWRRPSAEVEFLMRLLHRHVLRERATLLDQGIRFRTIGDLSRLPEGTRHEIERSIEMTKDNTGLDLVFALSYGGRQELLEAAQLIAHRAKQGQKAPETEAEFAEYLQTQPENDPDLIIRTSGEFRLSNFLLWQAAYSEFYFSQKHWPEFTDEDLDAAIIDYTKRERRYGQVQDSADADDNDGPLVSI